MDFYAMAVGMLRDDDDARDAVQEAVARTLARVAVNDPVAYCFQTVRHVAIDIMRRNMRALSLDDADLATDPEREALYRRLWHLHGTLPDMEQTIIELHDIEGYTYDEIATLTGLSKSTVRRHIKRIHKTMKDNLEYGI